MTNKKYKIGLDISSIGYFSLMNIETKEIVSICKVPQKLKISEYEKEITGLKPLLKVKGMKTKTQSKIVELKNKVLNSPRDIGRVMTWLMSCKNTYGVELANIEKPLIQTFGNSQISSFLKMAEYIGIVTTMLDYVGIKYNIVAIETWRNYYNYNKMDKAEVLKLVTKSKSKTTITREFAKKESVRIAEELIPNIKDFWIPKGCKKVNDDICESCLLGLYKGEHV
jgi:hypothetical protein